MNPVAVAVVLAMLVLVVGRPRPPTRRPRPDRTGDGDEGDESGDRSTTRFRRRAADDPTDVARWCDGLARAVRGGDSLRSALKATIPPPRHADELADINLELERTGHLQVSRSDLSSHLALALTVVGAALAHGGPAAEPLDRAAEVLRGRAAELAERRVQSAQATMSAQVMTALPMVMLTLLLATSSSVRSAIATPFGVVLIGVGGALNMSGWCWMRSIIRRAAR